MGAKAAAKAVPVSVKVTQSVVRICERTLKHQVSLLRKLMGVQDYAVVRGPWPAIKVDAAASLFARTHVHRSRRCAKHAAGGRRWPRVFGVLDALVSARAWPGGRVRRGYGWPRTRRFES